MSKAALVFSEYTYLHLKTLYSLLPQMLRAGRLLLRVRQVLRAAPRAIGIGSTLGIFYLVTIVRIFRDGATLIPPTSPCVFPPAPPSQRVCFPSGYDSYYRAVGECGRRGSEGGRFVCVWRAEQACFSFRILPDPPPPLSPPRERDMAVVR